MTSWLDNLGRLLVLWMAYLALQTPQNLWVGTRYGNQVLVPSNQLLNPAGDRIEFSQRPVDLALSPKGDVLAVLMPGSVRFYTPQGQFVRTVKIPTNASVMGIAFSPDGLKVAVSQWNAIALLSADGAQAPVNIPTGSASLPAGLAFDPSGTTLYAALNQKNQVARIDLAQGKIVQTADVGVAPLGLALAPSGRLFVSNWGGRRATAKDPTAASNGTSTVVDGRGVAATGTVSVVDVASFGLVAEVAVELHPGAIRISPDGTLAAVANANSDSVSFLDTSSLQVVSKTNVTAFPYDYLGSSPTALSFNPSGQRLYVACGGNNAVAVLQRQDAQHYGSQGFVPVDWYPIGVAVAAGAGGTDTAYVANSKGIGSRDSSGPYSVLNVLGTINIFSGSASNDASLQAVAFSNTPFQNASQPADSPANLGSLGIRYVFLIIKENRTYDQVLGDLGRGNGDPRLTMYGQDITPNHHALATQFVTLDNFYCSGIVSADGHQWITQATASDYIERSGAANWPRSYPFNGSDPLAFAASGFIWNKAQAQGLTVRIYGEFAISAGSSNRKWAEYIQDATAPQMQYHELSRSEVASVKAVLETSYPAYNLDVPDVFRARVFLDQFKQFVAQGNLPNLVIIWLPTDHTQGKAAGAPTPEAMVADNDLALGRIVEAISKSPYWPQSAIFVTEDDAQNGVDHVDGHRTVGLVISPFAQRGVVDSTHYNQTSMLRSIEEMLGMRPMNKFDAAALPMRSVFVTAPDPRPYDAAPNRVPLDTLNPAVSGLNGPARRAALDSMAMNFSVPDAAPEDKLNRILWHAAKGWKARYPRVPHGPNCQPD